MKISVKLIATLREKLPVGTEGNTCTIEVNDDCTVQEVLAIFEIPDDKTNVILVNGHTPSDVQILTEGDVVCAFSAIAGG